MLQHKDDGTLLYISPEYYTDTEGLIPVGIITPIFDAQSRREKQNGRMTFIADQIEGSKLQVRWSDDDYQTWSNWQTVDLSLADPILTQLGTFRKRAFHFQHKCNTFFRISAVEMQYDFGTL